MFSRLAYNAPKTSLRLLLAALCCVALNGCVQRTLTITSNPVGAEVFLDGFPVGKTPLDVQFEYYGTREILLRHDSQDPPLESASRAVELEAPWHQHFPIDLLFVFVPLKDRHGAHFDLKPLDVEAHMSKLQAMAEHAQDGAEIIVQPKEDDDEHDH